MPPDARAEFERDMGCTEAEWLRWLPQAVHGHGLQLGAGQARVAIDAGGLHLSWQTLPPRRIALLCLPRLGVRFRFDGVGDAARQRFLQRFDLHMQRGGG